MAKAAQYKYQVDPDANAQRRANLSARRRRIKDQLLAYKAGESCRMCPENEPVCLEFHHIDPRTKDHPPCDLARVKGWSFERIIAHLETTCIILCANCHRKIHKQLREKHHKSPARKTRRKAKTL